MIQFNSVQLLLFILKKSLKANDGVQNLYRMHVEKAFYYSVLIPVFWKSGVQNTLHCLSVNDACFYLPAFVFSWKVDGKTHERLKQYWVGVTGSNSQ